MFTGTPIHSRYKGGNSQGGFGRPANQPAQPLFQNGRNGVVESDDGNVFRRSEDRWGILASDHNEDLSSANRFLSPLRRLNPIAIQELEDEYEDVVDGSVYTIPPPESISARKSGIDIDHDSPSRSSDIYPSPSAFDPGQNEDIQQQKQQETKLQFPSLQPKTAGNSPYWGLSPIKISSSQDERPLQFRVEENINSDGSDDSSPENERKHSEIVSDDTIVRQPNQLTKPQSILHNSNEPNELPTNNTLFSNIVNRYGHREDEEAVDEYEDDNLSAHIIIDSARSTFKPIRRVVVIFSHTLWITLRDLFNSSIVRNVSALIVLIFAIAAIYGISKLSLPSFSSSPALSDIFEAPSNPPIDLEEWSKRLMSLESRLSHDSKDWASQQILAKGVLEKFQTKLSNLESQFNQELKSISLILTKIGTQVTDRDEWSQKVDGLLQEDHKLLYRLQQIISSQSEDITNVYKALDDQKTSISTISSSINNLKEVTNDGNEIDLEKFVSWEGLEAKLTTNFDQLQSEIGGQINDLTDKIEEIVKQVAIKLSGSGSNSKLDQFGARFEQLLKQENNKLAGQLTKVEGDVRDLYQSVDSRFRDQKIEINEELEYRLGGHHLTDISQSRRRFDKPNFADRNIGAKINKQITTPIYNPLADAPFLYRTFRNIAGVSGLGRYKLHSDENVLLPSMEAGKCWPFKGSQANLGVLLPSYIELESVGLEHVFHKSIVDPSTAPRIVSFWLEIIDADQRAEVEKLVLHFPENNLAAGLPPSYVKIFSFEYNVFSNEPLQVFQLPVQVKKLRLRTRNIVFHFEENWGNEIVSCVYRVLAFGKPCDPAVGGKVFQNTDEQEHIDGSVPVEEQGFGDDHDIDSF